MFDVGTYRYQCIDYSLLDPYLRTFLAKPLHKHIPIWFPANCISLIGHLCIWIVFFLTLHKSSDRVVWIGLLLLQLYMILDVLDGMQARVTKTGSPLGEYIDHGGDAFNCGLIVYSSLALLKVTSDWFYYVLIGLGLVIFSLVSLEKKITGFCVFPKIGNVELQTVLIVFFAALQIPWIGDSLDAIWLGFSIATWVLFSIALVGGLSSIISSLRRIGLPPKPYCIFLFLSGLLIVILITQEKTCTTSTLILIFFMATYNSEILFSHLAQQPLPWPDWASSLLIALLVVMSHLGWFVPNEFFYAFLAYLFLRAFLSVMRVFRYYGQFWVWINPAQSQ